jgi:nucleoside-diphosphate-sugar epimerase
MQALIIGGTGPTGPHLVRGMLQRGYRVTILHTGNHERPEIPDEVEHIHTDPYSEQKLRAALEGRSFDACIATYGRLRRIAAILAGRVGHFVSIGGAPASRGYMNPALPSPQGLQVPVRESDPLVSDPSEDEKGWRIVRTEEAVFEHHPNATHYRYPYVYGPHQPMPRDWCIVRRIRDERPHIVLPDGGLTINHQGYVENVAHAVLLAFDNPKAAAGQIYHCADEHALTLRQVVEIAARELGRRIDIVSMPWDLATPARPLIGQPLTTHRIFALDKLRTELDYRDVVPAADACARTVRWLVSNPPQPGGHEETILQDPFDYAAEDQLVEAWHKTLANMPEVEFASEPGYTMAYSGPGGRPRTTSDFE